MRYYLLRRESPFGDSDFSTQTLKTMYNADLANGLGNLISRLCTLGEKANYGRLDYSGIPSAPDGYHAAIGNYDFDNSLKTLWAIVTHLNKDIDTKRPWETLKGGNISLLRAQLTEWLNELSRVAYWLGPLLPLTSTRLKDILLNRPIIAQPPFFLRIR